MTHNSEVPGMDTVRLIVRSLKDGPCSTLRASTASLSHVFHWRTAVEGRTCSGPCVEWQEKVTVCGSPTMNMSSGEGRASSSHRVSV